MANPFVHVELHTQDVAAAKKFYSSLFGWKLEDMPMPEGRSYTMVNVGEGTGGGMMKNPDPKVPPHWLAYVGVDNCDKLCERATMREQLLVLLHFLAHLHEGADAAGIGVALDREEPTARIHDAHALPGQSLDADR